MYMQYYLYCRFKTHIGFVLQHTLYMEDIEGVFNEKVANERGEHTHTYANTRIVVFYYARLCVHTKGVSKISVKMKINL